MLSLKKAVCTLRTSNLARFFLGVNARPEEQRGCKFTGVSFDGPKSIKPSADRHSRISPAGALWQETGTSVPGAAPKEPDSCLQHGADMLHVGGCVPHVFSRLPAHHQVPRLLHQPFMLHIHSVPLVPVCVPANTHTPQAEAGTPHPTIARK